MSNPINVTVSFTYTPTMEHYPDGYTPIQAARMDFIEGEDIALLLEDRTMTISVVDTVTGESDSDEVS
ncbi:hypothetical protein [Gordonia sihwensis]|uniref:hypothetical protein n=1 Tax=Gordonia sihwensis TaxID=173559 RepID=UPI003D98216B